MLRCCLGAYGRPNHAWMPSLGAGLIRLSQVTGASLTRCGGQTASALVETCTGQRCKKRTIGGLRAAGRQRWTRISKPTLAIFRLYCDCFKP